MFIPALMFVGAVNAIISSLGAPLLPQIAKDLDASISEHAVGARPPRSSSRPSRLHSWAVWVTAGTDDWSWQSASSAVVVGCASRRSPHRSVRSSSAARCRASAWRSCRSPWRQPVTTCPLRRRAASSPASQSWAPRVSAWATPSPDSSPITAASLRPTGWAPGSASCRSRWRLWVMSPPQRGRRTTAISTSSGRSWSLSDSSWCSSHSTRPSTGVGPHRR